MLSAILHIQIKNNALIKIMIAELCESLDKESDKELELLTKANELSSTMFYDLMGRLMK